MKKKSVFFENLIAADVKVQYDEYVKKILANKDVLARILQKVVEEYQGFSVEEIKDYIEPQIQLSCVPVRPGYEIDGICKGSENLNIQGDRTEDKVPGEGMITYDIRLHTWLPDKAGGISVKLLINIEAQKNFYREYSMATRGIFYGTRMISSQLDTEFSASDYNSIKKVYSIWICMNAPKKIGNSMAEYRIKKHDMIGYIPEKKKNYDKLSIIMICLNEKILAKKGSIHHFLNTLLSPNMQVEDKKKILVEEYHMKLEAELEEVVKEMCNLSEAIEESGIKKGIKKGINKGIRALVETCAELGVSKEKTIERVRNKMSISSKKANEYVNKYWV